MDPCLCHYYYLLILLTGLSTATVLHCWTEQLIGYSQKDEHGQHKCVIRVFHRIKMLKSSKSDLLNKVHHIHKC